MSLNRIEFFLRIFCVIIIVYNSTVSDPVNVFFPVVYLVFFWLSLFRGFRFRGFPIEGVSFSILVIVGLFLFYNGQSGQSTFVPWVGLFILPVMLPVLLIWIVSYLTAIFRVRPSRSPSR